MALSLTTTTSKVSVLCNYKVIPNQNNKTTHRPPLTILPLGHDKLTLQFTTVTTPASLLETTPRKPERGEPIKQLLARPPPAPRFLTPAFLFSFWSPVLRDSVATYGHRLSRLGAHCFSTVTPITSPCTAPTRGCNGSARAISSNLQNTSVLRGMLKFFFFFSPTVCLFCLFIWPAFCVLFPRRPSLPIQLLARSHHGDFTTHGALLRSCWELSLVRYELVARNGCSLLIIMRTSATDATAGPDPRPPPLQCDRG